MAITAADLLACAQGLSASAKDETAYRNAVGRAYYSAYHDCKAWHNGLPKQGVKTPSGGVHEQFIHQLMNPQVTGPQFGQSRARASLLRHAKALRHDADYKLGKSITAADAAQAIQYAVSIAAIV